MVDSPNKIQKDIDNNRYKWQDYDVSKQIRYAIGHKLKYVIVQYHVCSKLEEELKSKVIYNDGEYIVYGLNNYMEYFGGGVSK